MQKYRTVSYRIMIIEKKTLHVYMLLFVLLIQCMLVKTIMIGLSDPRDETAFLLPFHIPPPNMGGR